MKFLYTDDQTVEDLGLFNSKSGNSIFDIYNTVHTRKGEDILREMFRKPLADEQAIQERNAIIQQFSEMKIDFPFTASSIDTAEKYLLYSNTTSKDGGIYAASLSEKELQSGVSSVVDIIRTLDAFVAQTDIASLIHYKSEREAITALLDDSILAPVVREESAGKLSYSALAAFDVLFRVRALSKIEAMLQHIYRLDVYLSVAKVTVKYGFTFPLVLGKGLGNLMLKQVYHPELKNPEANDFNMEAGNNLKFLTGANMAGKSTFLRSVSTAMYLAHMGFPVAAKAMQFSVMDGLYTTINLPDKLGIGASHFYMEVLRVKKVAAELSQGKSLFVIFDELFRGTNVKDAHEATVAVSIAFAKKKGSLFIISSHIVEAFEQLAPVKSISFQYLPTLMNGTVPQYTYKLCDGVTEDRHGMIIIRNEGILDILEKGSKDNSSTAK